MRKREREEGGRGQKLNRQDASCGLILKKHM